MATIDEIIGDEETWLRFLPDTPLNNLRDPEFAQLLFAPLHDAGFTDFTLLSTAGTASLFLAPTGNDQIVFRVTCESAVRRNDIPFFLAGPTISECQNPLEEEEGNKLRLEVLLRARETSVPEKDKEYLLEEMQRVGWEGGSSADDIITITLRDKNGRTRAVPVFSDPSDLDYRFAMYKSLPAGAENADGTLNSSILNRCSSDYITLQDQAAAYNAAREADTRLKKLIPKPVEFPETEVIPVKTIDLPASNNL